MWDTTTLDLNTLGSNRSRGHSSGKGQTGAPGSPKRTWAEKDGRSPTKGRLKVAQDAVLGSSRPSGPVPKGRLNVSTDHPAHHP